MNFLEKLIQRSLAKFGIPIALFVVALGSIGTIQRANGTGMNWWINGGWTDCLAPYSSGSWTHVYNQGPSGKTWSIQASIGLYPGSDNNQYVHWDFQLIDSNYGPSWPPIAEYRGSTAYWETVGQYMYGDTLAASASGTITVQSDIYNDDAQQQCFYVLMEGYWY